VKAFFDAELEWARERALPALEAGALLGGPYVDARVGDFDVAREKLARSRTICRELGIAYGLAEAAMAAGELEVLAGDLPAAERELEEAIALAADMEAAHYVVVYQVRLARVLNDQGRHEEADAVLKQAASLYDTRPWCKSNRARVLAAQGEIDEAVTLAREAAAEEDGDEDPTSAALTLMDLAEVLRAAGDDTGAEAAVSEAVALNEQKGNTVAARQCRERLAAIQA
jgi:tetratricopeptide (TPR) repeat protein